MFDFIKDNLILNDPMLIGANISILLSVIGIVFILTYFKKWKWLWTEWLTTVDHKKNRNYVYYCCYCHAFPWWC
jgi:cytochrome aa3-600 menaquinol oxidase subunit 1